jgi:pimeloyl-ACP methyl ester carboxylesterase
MTGLPHVDHPRRTDVRTLPRTTPVVLAALICALAACGGSGSTGESTTSAPVAPTTSAPAASTTAAPTTAAPTTIPETTIPETTAAPPADLRDGRPSAIETVTVTFVDESRPTEPPVGDPAPSRTLETTVHLPVGDAPVPLIIFSHGYGGHPSKFDRLLISWAEAGYAVAAPAFPLTNDGVDESMRVIGDGANQPADVVFVLDQLLDSEYADRFDTERIAAAGLSLGGFTTYLAAVDANTGDERISSAIVMGAVPPGPDFIPRDIPVMVMHGELDPVMPLELATSTEAQLTGPSYMVTLLGAFHAEAFEDADANVIFPDRELYHSIVDTSTLAFWDTYLLADPMVEGDIRAAADQAGVSTVTARNTD